MSLPPPSVVRAASSVGKINTRASDRDRIQRRSVSLTFEAARSNFERSERDCESAREREKEGNDIIALKGEELTKTT